ncbi:MAG: YIP1 family protein [Candidatus Acidiferrales bacterium]
MATTTVAPEAQPSISAFGRIVGVITNPKATFTDIARKPSWILPIVLFVVLNCVVTFAFGQRVGWRSFMEKQFENNPRTANLTADQRQQQLDSAVKIAPIFGYVGTIVGVPVVALIVAGILLGIFNVMAGAGTNFKTSLAIVAHGWVPGLIGGILGLILIYIKDPSTVDIQHLVASNLGVLTQNDSAKWLVALLTSIDIFTFWVIALMAVGYSATNPKKVKFGKACTLIFVAWAVYVVLKVGWTAVFS